jgi:hypothetical protein
VFNPWKEIAMLPLLGWSREEIMNDKCLCCILRKLILIEHKRAQNNTTQNKANPLERKMKEKLYNE